MLGNALEFILNTLPKPLRASAALTVSLTVFVFLSRLFGPVCMALHTPQSWPFNWIADV